MRPTPELPRLEFGARVSLTPPSNASWPTGPVTLMLLVTMAQNPRRLLGKLRANAPAKIPMPPGPPRPPRKKLALRRSVLCSDPHLCPSTSRASPWPTLLHIFPELPGNFLPLHLCESCPNSFAYLLCDSQGYPISRPGCSASDPSCCSASGPSRCSGCTTHRLRYLDHSARPETSC